MSSSETIRQKEYIGDLLVLTSEFDADTDSESWPGAVPFIHIVLALSGITDSSWIEQVISQSEVTELS